MPIFGRSGESMSQRLFGREGYQLGSKIVNPVAIAKRVSKGINTPGGFLGPRSDASSIPRNNIPNTPSVLGMTDINTKQFDTKQGPPRSAMPDSGSQNTGGIPTASVKKDYSSRNQSALDKLRKLEIGQIEDAYNTEKKRLNRLTDLTNTQYGTARQNLLNYQPQLEQEKGTQLQGVEDERVTREQESKSALQQVRQLLADQQRRAQAYLSATGNFSSSIPGAQSEMFSRMANKGLSDVQTQRNQAMTAIENKKQQVNDFFSRKSLELQDNLANLEQQHLAQLDAIANAKSQSRAAKNQATTEAWKQYVSQRVNIENQLMNTEAQWKAYSQQYGSDLNTDMDSFVGTLDQSDGIYAPDALQGVSDAEDYTGTGAVRSGFLPNATDEENQSLLQALLSSNY